MKDRVHESMTFVGASPIIFVLTGLLSIPVIIINILYAELFHIAMLQPEVVIGFAGTLIVIGTILYVRTFRVIAAGFAAGKLLTTGPFSRCRNPLFAEVIFLILPGIVLVFDSWFLLSIPLIMYVMVKIFIGREERLLEHVFGNEYAAYKKRVPLLVPRFRQPDRSGFPTSEQ